MQTLTIENIGERVDSPPDISIVIVCQRIFLFSLSTRVRERAFKKAKPVLTIDASSTVYGILTERSFFLFAPPSPPIGRDFRRAGGKRHLSRVSDFGRKFALDDFPDFVRLFFASQSRKTLRNPPPLRIAKRRSAATAAVARSLCGTKIVFSPANSA